MTPVDAHLRPAVQIDSKTIEAYYRERFVPQLKQSGSGEVPLEDVSAKDCANSSLSRRLAN